VRGENGHQQSKWTTFENYIVGRWEFGIRRGYQIINAADLTQKIAYQSDKTLTDKDEKSEQFVRILPQFESHLRPLISDLRTDSEKVKVWNDMDGRLRTAFVEVRRN
jgi:hypothetical protein